MYLARWMDNCILGIFLISICSLETSSTTSTFKKTTWHFLQNNVRRGGDGQIALCSAFIFLRFVLINNITEVGET